MCNYAILLCYFYHSTILLYYSVCCFTNLSDSKLLYKSGGWKRRKPESRIGTGTRTEIGTGIGKKIDRNGM